MKRYIIYGLLVAGCLGLATWAILTQGGNPERPSNQSINVTPITHVPGPSASKPVSAQSVTNQSPVISFLDEAPINPTQPTSDKPSTATLLDSQSPQSQQEYIPEPTIIPPVLGLAPSFDLIEKVVSTTEKTVFHTGKNTVMVPPGALVDAHNNPVQGKVEFRFRVLDDAKKIFLSGVPMRYDSAGKVYNLESGGMFELRAYQNGQPLRIAQGQKVVVKLSCQKKDGHFNFYSFNEANSAWKLNNQAVISTEDEPNEEPIISASPKNPELSTVIEQVAIPMRLYISDQHSRMIRFDYNFRAFSNPNAGIEPTQMFDMDIVAVTQKPPVKGLGGIDDVMQWIGKKRHFYTEIHEKDPQKGEYYLKLIQRDSRFYRHEPHSTIANTMTAVVKPVIKTDMNAVWQNVQLAYNNFIHQENKAKAKQKAEHLKVQTVLRTAGITNFGIHNYDRVMSMTNAVKVKPRFSFASSRERFTPNAVYVVYKHFNTVIKFERHELNKHFYMLADSPYMLFGLTEDGQLVTLSDEHKPIFLTTKSKQDVQPAAFLMALPVRSEEKSITTAFDKLNRQ